MPIVRSIQGSNLDQVVDMSMPAPQTPAHLLNRQPRAAWEIAVEAFQQIRTEDSRVRRRPQQFTFTRNRRIVTRRTLVRGRNILRRTEHVILECGGHWLLQ